MPDLKRCPSCDAEVSLEANFCKNCGAALAPAKKTNERTAEDRKPQQTSAPSFKGVVKVPEWNTYYPSLSNATEEQTEFYTFWKDNLEKGIAVDIEGNLSYLFVYAYDAIYRFVDNKNIDELVASFERLQKGYSNYEKVAYLDDWLADAWITIDDYDAAWQILRKASKLRLTDVLNIRAKCSDTSVDGYDMLSILGKSALTKFGRAHRDEIANCATSFLADFHRKNGANFIEHFCKQFKVSSLSEAYVTKPERNKTYLFSGVPFSINVPRVGVDPETQEAVVLRNESVQRPYIASEELPKVVEPALIYEIKNVLRGCENRLKEGIINPPKLNAKASSKKEKAQRPKKAQKNPILFGAVVRENLPYPVVYYPNAYGTFFAFAKDESSQPALCLCSKPAIENLTRLKQENPGPYNVKPLRRAFFDSRFFPNIIASNSLKSQHDPFEDLCFVEGLCHRCNLTAPSLRYCHEMYGGEFIQHYGWYLNQEYLRLGIYPMHFLYLKDVCLPEHQTEIESFKAAREDYRKEYLRLSENAHGPLRDDIAPDEITYWHNVRYEEAKEMIKLHRIAAKKERAFTTKIENIVRQEFGFRDVGDGWVSETILYQIVKRIFVKQQILRHDRPDWLEGLELDIFAPSLHLAFEYQGQQHFHPIPVWGGAKALQELRERDERKARLCASYGIDLVTIDYTEPLTENYVLTILENKGLQNC